MTNTAPDSVAACTVQIKRALRNAGIATRTVRTRTAYDNQDRRRFVQHSVAFLINDDECEQAARVLREIGWVRDAVVSDSGFVSVSGPLD